MSDNITLPREVVQLALEAFEAVMPFSTTQRELKIRAVEALRAALAAEQPKREFDHGIGADRFKVVRGTFWWHVKIGDSPTEHGKFRSSEAAQKMADDLLREFRNGAFVQNALAAEQPKQEPVAWQCREHGDDEWFGCSKEAYGINPSRYVYRCLYAAPPDSEALRREEVKP